MSRIYEGEVKLNTIQVIGNLANEIPQSHIDILARHMNQRDDGWDRRTTFAHSVLDCYKALPTETSEEEKSKKYCKYLMERYMKSATIMDGEDSSYQMLFKKILDEASTEEEAAEE